MCEIYDKKIVVESVEEAFHNVLDDLRVYGEKSSPRGYEITELQNCNIIIKNPRNRIVGCMERNFSAPYAFGELAWYLSGNNRLDQIKYYSKFQEGCSDDGQTLNSAYGARIFGIHPDGEQLEKYYPKIEFNQWEQCVNILRNDKDSRQAIIHLHTPNNKKTKDEVCTLTLQFLIRNDQLNLIVTMRSNDILLGFTYDAFAFTMLQELMANELGVKLGYYCHNVGSMHIYTKEYYGRKDDILQRHTKADVAAMQPVKFCVGDKYCAMFIEVERRLRKLSAQFKKGLPINVINDMLDESMRQIDALTEEWQDDEFKNFMLTAFLVKAMRNSLDKQREVIEKVREKGYEFVSDICALFTQNTKDYTKIIIEGPDGAGKTTLARSIMNKCKDRKFDFVHFVVPSERFDFDCGYTFHLQHNRSEIIDRFVFSEIIYSKVFERRREVSEKKYDKIIRMMRRLDAKVYICVAVGEAQRNKLLQRRPEEPRDLLLQINDEYVILAKNLREAGLKVFTYDIDGKPANI